MRHGYVLPMRWMVIYEYGVPGGALNLNSTNYPDNGHHGDPSLSGKNPHGRTENRTRDLLISSQKRWPLDHEAGLRIKYILCVHCFEPTNAENSFVNHRTGPQSRRHHWLPLIVVSFMVNCPLIVTPQLTCKSLQNVNCECLCISV
jgi:hypothetical protein